MRIDPLRGLNDGQARAASADGNVLVLSPAGSGKTKTVQAAVLRIIGDGYSPDGILVLTFTNKAAEELIARIERGVGRREARRIRTGTFHGFCARTIRDYAETVGRTDGFTIYDDDDRNDLARKVAGEMGAKVGRFGYEAIRKKLGQDPTKLGTFDALYAEALVRNNAFDYDGLETGMLAVLEGNAGARAEMAGLHHILVDEYQDTSPIQARIVGLLQQLAAQASVMRVGDPAQSIYGFRGAAVENIQALAKDPAVTVINLPTNYRSGRRIVALGNALAPGAGSPLDNVQTGRDLDGEVDLYQHDTEEQASERIAAMVAAQIARGATPGQHMILGRTWRDLDETAAALARAGISAEIARNADSVWTTTAMRQIVAAMRCGQNPRDVLAFRRLVSWPSEAVTSAEIARAEAELTGLDSLVRRFHHVLRVAAVSVGQRFEAQGSEPGPAEWAALYVETAEIREELTEAGLETQAAEVDRALLVLAAWGRARTEAGRGALVADFLTWHAFRRVLDAQAEEHNPETGPARLMTVHASKGLQARFVHVVGLEAKFWPQGDADEKEQAEERRVFYVACTRAEDGLVLHTCRTRRATFGDKIVTCQTSPLLVPVAGALSNIEAATPPGRPW